jgi:hypothetical protein
MVPGKHVWALLLAVLGFAGLGLVALPAKDRKLPEDAPLRLDGSASSVAFSPDGTMLACNLTLRQLPGGAERAEAKTPEDTPPCTFVRFSPDGRRLASVHFTGDLVQQHHELRLWNVGPGGIREAARLFHSDEHTGSSLEPLHHLVFSPDGTKLATRAPRDRAVIWDVASGKEIRRLDIRGLAVTFTADGRSLVSVTRAGRVRHWDVDTGKCKATPGDKAPDNFIYVTQAIASDDGKTLALTDEHAVVIKDARTGRLLRHLGDIGVGETGTLALSRDGNLLATGEDGKVALFDTSSGHRVGGWGRAKEYDGPLAFSPDGKWLAAGRESVHVWSVASLRHRAGPDVKQDPTGGNLEVTITSRKQTYTTALGNETPAQFARRFELGDKYPRGAEVDLVVNIKNTSNRVIILDEEMEVWLHIVGPGAVNHPSFPFQVAVQFEEYVKRITLRPGESHAIPVKQLERHSLQCSCWLLPGEYTIHASCFVSANPKLDGWFRFTDGQTFATLTAIPLRVNVVAEKSK